MGDQTSTHPHAEDWQRFWAAAEKAKVFQWPRCCRGNEDVCDGTQWELDIEYGGRTVRSEGSNSYPFTDKVEPSAEFEMFVEALSKLLGQSLRKWG